MIIDCDRCRMRDLACHDCVVTVLLGPIGGAREGFDLEERAALGVLADSGLVPPLRLAVAGDTPSRGEAKSPSGRAADGIGWRSVI